MLDRKVAVAMCATTVGLAMGTTSAFADGKIGTVTGQCGENYKVKIRDGGKEKILYVHPVHLKQVA